MDETKYEKIDGREALKRLVNGERIYSDCEYSFELGTDNRYPSIRRFVGEYKKGMDDSYFSQPLTLHDLCGRDWYIKKPFDVRQAMLDRPNEWVGAYKSGMGFWFKVGFDTDSMNAVFEELERDGLPFLQQNRVRPSMLKNCIPIEDVPEEATR